MRIHSATAREILDSRGNPTVAASVELENGTIAEASVPSGASTGSHEDIELRDRTSDRFFGMGVLEAVGNVNNIIGPAIMGLDAGEQREIDKKICELDGTKNKGNLGANATLAVSLAVSRAASISAGSELFEYLSFLYFEKKEKISKIPTPMFNILNGGSHAKNNIDIQETMVVPQGFKTYEEKLRAGAEIYHALRNILINQGLEVGLGDEGGFAPNLSKNEDIFEIIEKAIKEAGYDDKKIMISIDLAATSLFDASKKTYHLSNNNKNLTSEQLTLLVSQWVKKWKLLSVEDGLSEDDPLWIKLTEKIAPAISIGDDLFTTDPEKIEIGGQKRVAGGVIIKPNQIGTLSEAMEAIRKARESNLKVIISHRSGETEDSFIADLAVAVEADFIKSGAPARSERLAKYNRLSKIEDVIANQ